MAERDFLLEIGCEEIPARFVEDAVSQLKERVEKWLWEKRIDHQGSHTYATPRRLALRIEGMAERQRDVEEVVRGPAKRIALKEDGKWGPAAEGFARKQGVSLDDLYFDEYKGEEYLFARRVQEGKPAAECLAEGLPEVLSSIHLPGAMRWGSGRARFIRPVRWLVCLFGTETIPFAWAGVTAGNRTRGHRFLGEEVELSSPAEYPEVLRSQWVIADVAERRQRILDQLRRLEVEKGWRIPVDEGLLDEVTHLVEYPTVLAGSFDEKFLALPPAVLITTMREHQRYFPVKAEDGSLLPHFVTVRNGDDVALEQVARGNQKVLKARLADARFFLEEDLKLPVDEAVSRLDQIVFHEKLGSVGEKVRRVRTLALAIADWLELDEETVRKIDRAARICKFDLSTQMVDEFPELEGIMGEEYARRAGEDPEVARAVFEHHLPRHAGDELPASVPGTVLALADKMDAQAAFLGIGIQPSGSQDPYGLRRRAAGLIQILLNRDWPAVTLGRLWEQALDLLEDKGLLTQPVEEVKKQLAEFFALRLRTVLQEESIRHDVADAVLAAGVDDPRLTVEKARLLVERLKEEEAFKPVVEAFNRTANLGRKGDPERAVDPSLMEEEAERLLWDAYRRASDRFEAFLTKRDVPGMYQALAEMAPAIHRFFDEVFVMAEDEAVRANRLALLRRVTDLVKRFAHFDRLIG
ncbi:MAG: glycine--tRNA ligase subunit beta [Planifilum sp.]